MSRLDRRVVLLIIRTAVYFALSACALVFAVGKHRDIGRSLPHAVSVYNDDGLGITLAQAADLQYAGLSAYGAYSRPVQLGLIGGGDGTAEFGVTAYYAAPGSADILLYKFLEGGALAGQDKSAIIPHTLASDAGIALGSCVTIGGAEYAVAGIYLEDKGWAAGIAGGGHPRVWLYDEELCAVTQAAELLLADGQGANPKQVARSAMYSLKAPISGKMLDYRNRIDLSRALMLLATLFYSFFSAAALLCCAGRHMALAIERVRDPLRVRLARGLPAFAAAALVFFGLYSHLEALRIPGIYLPRDNIFDFSHYASQVKSFLTGLRVGAAYYDWLFALKLAGMLSWLLLSVVFFCAFMIALLRISRNLWHKHQAPRQPAHREE